MNLHGGYNPDATLFDAVLRLAREECAHTPWQDIEPMLAASWERLRKPTSPSWTEIVERVRACCQDAGTRH
jgi:hypothetical protein